MRSSQPAWPCDWSPGTHQTHELPWDLDPADNLGVLPLLSEDLLNCEHISCLADENTISTSFSTLNFRSWIPLLAWLGCTEAPGRFSSFLLPKESPFPLPFTRKSAPCPFTWRERIPHRMVFFLPLPPHCKCSCCLTTGCHPHTFPSRCHPGRSWAWLPYSAPFTVLLPLTSTVRISDPLIHRAPATGHMALTSSKRVIQTKHIHSRLNQLLLQHLPTDEEAGPRVWMMPVFRGVVGDKLFSMQQECSRTMPTMILCSCWVWMQAVMLYFVAWAWIFQTSGMPQLYWALLSSTELQNYRIGMLSSYRAEGGGKKCIYRYVSALILSIKYSMKSSSTSFGGRQPRSLCSISYYGAMVCTFPSRDFP